MIELHGKVAIVSGGATIIGRTIAGRLADAGAKVAIADIQDLLRIDAVQQLKTALARHVNVEEQHIRPIAPHDQFRFAGVRRFTDDVEIESFASLQENTQAFPRELLVVDDGATDAHLDS